MGITRKMLSVSTLGAVDYRSAKDKTVRNTRKALREQRRQTAALKRLLDEAVSDG